MSETSPPPVPHDSIWNHPVAIVGAAALAGAAILAGTLYLAGILVAGDTGDEPPIRVKNGSVDFYLASRKDTWKMEHDKLFTITGGKRSKDALDVVVAVTATGAASCSAQTDTGDLVTLEYVKSDASVADAHDRHRSRPAEEQAFGRPVGRAADPLGQGPHI